MASESDYLTAVEIEAIEAALAGIEGRYVTQKSATELEEIAGKLLRHLRALAAPADGEALGRTLCDALAAEEVAFGTNRGIVYVPEPWASLPETLRAMHSRAALRLHAIGHAAGVLSRATVEAGATEEIARLEETAEDLRAEIARLTAELEETQRRLATTERNFRALCDDRDTWRTLAETRGAHLSAERDCGQADVCATPPGCHRHWEERNRELAAKIVAQHDAQNARDVAANERLGAAQDEIRRLSALIAASARGDR